MREFLLERQRQRDTETETEKERQEMERFSVGTYSRLLSESNILLCGETGELLREWVHCKNVQ